MPKCFQPFDLGTPLITSAVPAEYLVPVLECPVDSDLEWQEASYFSFILHCLAFVVGVSFVLCPHCTDHIGYVKRNLELFWILFLPRKLAGIMR
jgi:hypothetical protein